MSEAEIIHDVEVIGTELEPVTSGTLFRTDDPVQIIAQASAVAEALSQVIRQKKLFKRIGDKDHVFVEGWTLLGTMLGVFPVVEWSRPVEGGWEARAEAKTLAGQVVGAAEAECLRSESKWKNRTEAISVWDETTHDLFGEFVKATARLLFGPTVDIKKLSASDKKFLLLKAAGASVHLREKFDPNTLPYPGVQDIRAAFAEVLDGQELALPSETTEPQATT
jgi:hypothetical protein